MIQEKSSNKRIYSAFRVGALPVFLMLALLGSQAVSLQHDHEGELAHHLDCSICVKQNSETDFLLPSVGVVNATQASAETSNPVLSEISNTPLVVNSRGPPLS